MLDKLYIIGPALIAMIIFIYMRNKQADRNDRRRERLWKREEELMKLLTKKKEEETKTTDAAEKPAD